MRWCALVEGDTIVQSHPTFGVSFGWDTTIDDNYPIDPTRTNLLEEVIARLNLYDPDIGTTPAIETGGTWVKFPTWLWVTDPLDSVHRYAVNDRETLRVEIRARLDGISFTHGPQTIECGPDDMLAFDPDTHDPIDDAPDCTIAHDEVGDYHLGTTLTYIIEQRIEYAYDGNFNDDKPWEPHEAGTVARDIDLGNYPVQELHSLITIGGT